MKIPKDVAQQAVADSLVEAYKGERLTQPELAKRAGITDRTLQRYLSGATEIGTATFLMLAEAIGVDPSDIIDRAQARAQRRVERMSDAPTKTDDLETKRKQKAVAEMSTAEIEALDHAATRDPELDTDEPEQP